MTPTSLALPKIGQVYSCLEHGREVFTGTCTKLLHTRDGDVIVRLEGKNQAYHSQRLSTAQFVDPKDAPKIPVLTAKQRNEQILQKF